jgi:hypothetical protein
MKPKDPSSAAGKMRAHVLDLIKQHRATDTLPTNCRFLFYELVAKGIVGKEHTHMVMRKGGVG